VENEERNDRGGGYNRYYRGDGDGSYTGYQGGGGRQGDYTSSRRSKAMMMGDSGSGGLKSMMKSASGKFVIVTTWQTFGFRHMVLMA
jgi:hypothetical protein